MMKDVRIHMWMTLLVTIRIVESGEEVEVVEKELTVT